MDEVVALEIDSAAGLNSVSTLFEIAGY